MGNVLHQHTWKRAAALTALFAILLIVVAPLISVSLQKDPMSAMPGMHHDMSMMSMDAHHAIRRIRCLSTMRKRAVTACC